MVRSAGSRGGGGFSNRRARSSAVPRNPAVTARLRARLTAKGAGRSQRPAISEDDAIGARAPRHPLPIEVLEERDDELAGEARHLLQVADVEARSFGPA